MFSRLEYVVFSYKKRYNEDTCKIERLRERLFY